MSESDIVKFQGLFDRGELLAPEQYVPCRCDSCSWEAC